MIIITIIIIITITTVVLTSCRPVVDNQVLLSVENDEYECVGWQFGQNVLL